MARSPVTIDQITEACERDDYTGICLRCGEEQGGCEPDASRYKCENCGAHSVYGAEQLAIMFFV